MKNKTLLLGGLSFSAMAALGLIACGDSSSSSGNPLEFNKGDLPACATNTDGSLLIVEGKLQQCMGKDTTWQEIICDKGKKLVASMQLADGEEYYNILCGSDTVGVLLNEEAESCKLEGKGTYKITCDGDSLGVITIKDAPKPVEESSSSVAEDEDDNDDEDDVTEESSSSSSKKRSSSSRNEDESSGGNGGNSEKSSSSKGNTSEENLSSSVVSEGSSSSVAPASSSQSETASSSSITTYKISASSTYIYRTASTTISVPGLMNCQYESSQYGILSMFGEPMISLDNNCEFNFSSLIEEESDKTITISVTAADVFETSEPLTAEQLPKAKTFHVCGTKACRPDDFAFLDEIVIWNTQEEATLLESYDKNNLPKLFEENGFKLNANFHIYTKPIVKDKKITMITIYASTKNTITGPITTIKVSAGENNDITIK